MKNIEVEFRSIISESKFYEIEENLNDIATFLGEDDKNVFFCILENKLLKISDNVSKNSAKITLKLNEIGNGPAFEELEVYIDRKDVSTSLKIFENLGYTKYQKSFQKRKNYLYKGVTIALKYSEAWSYHIEFEIIVNEENEIPVAEYNIKQLANELGINLMTDEELKEFTNNYNKSYSYESSRYGI